MSSRIRLGLMAVAAVATAASAPASAQTLAATGSPPPLVQAPAKPMTPARVAWLKGRCAQLVAFFDYYGTSRGENSDGARNHERIRATIECSEGEHRTGIDRIAVLLRRKAFDIPKPGTPVIEPEDMEVPDITNPTQKRY